MSNIRLYFSKSLSNNLIDTLDKSQSHYVNKVMRVKENELFSLFNSSGEWEAKILNISKGIVEFNVTKQLRQKENSKELNRNAGTIFPEVQLIAAIATSDTSALSISIYPDKQSADKAIEQRDKYHAERGNVEVVMAHEGKLNGFYHRPIVKP